MKLTIERVEQELLVKGPGDSQGVSIGVQVWDNKLCSLSFSAVKFALHST